MNFWYKGPRLHFQLMVTQVAYIDIFLDGFWCIVDICLKVQGDSLFWYKYDRVI